MNPKLCNCYNDLQRLEFAKDERVDRPFCDINWEMEEGAANKRTRLSWGSHCQPDTNAQPAPQHNLQSSLFLCRLSGINTKDGENKKLSSGICSAGHFSTHFIKIIIKRKTVSYIEKKSRSLFPKMSPSYPRLALVSSQPFLASCQPSAPLSHATCCGVGISLLSIALTVLCPGASQSRDNCQRSPVLRV